jgi:hypothetical protein
MNHNNTLGGMSAMGGMGGVNSVNINNMGNLGHPNTNLPLGGQNSNYYGNYGLSRPMNFLNSMPPNNNNPTSSSLFPNSYNTNPTGFNSRLPWSTPNLGLGDTRFGDPRYPKKHHRHRRRHRHHRSNKSSSSVSSRSTRTSRSSYSKYPDYNKPFSNPYERRYDVSDSDSDSEYSSRKSGSYRGLNALQKKMVLKTIRDYCPDNMQNVVYEDLMSQMEQLEKKGFRLPKGYDARKHDISENEIRLYEQQLQRDKSKDQKKMAGLINFAAIGLSAFCRFISVDWIKTTHLPGIIRQALEDGEFEDSMEGIGMYLRGSVVDHPVFSTVLKFCEKIGQSHHQEMEEEQEKLEQEEERKEIRHTATLNTLNKFRQPQQQHAHLDVPPPKTSSSVSMGTTTRPMMQPPAATATTTTNTIEPKKMT